MQNKWPGARPSPTATEEKVIIQSRTGTVTADARYSFTAHFLHAAAIFVRRAYEIEAVTSHNTEQITEHRGYVVGAVMQSVAALEAEIYEVTAHGPGHHLGSNHIDAKAREFLVPLVDLIDNQDVLERYHLVLHLLQKGSLARDSALWENTLLLIRLRNALVHYKSQWGRDISPKLLAGLQKLALPRPPFISRHEFFFPNQCLSAARGAWAVDTSFKFLTTFYELLGFPAPIAHVAARVEELIQAR